MKMGDSRSRNVSQARSSVNGATGNRPAGTQAGSSGGRPGPKRISRKQREMRRKRQQLMAVSLILVLLIVILFAVLIKSCGNKKPQTDNVTTPAVSQPETQNEQGNASQSDGENNNQDNGQNNSGNSVQEKEYTGEDGKLHKVIGTTEKGYTIEEVDGVTYVDGVLIANKTYQLPEDFIPTNPEVPVTEGNVTRIPAIPQQIRILLISNRRTRRYVMSAMQKIQKIPLTDGVLKCPDPKNFASKSEKICRNHLPLE